MAFPINDAQPPAAPPFALPPHWRYSFPPLCSLGIVAEVPPFADRPTISEGSLAWAGQQSVITPAAQPAKPASKAKAKAGRGRGGKRGG